MFLVPRLRLEPVADELLVEGRWADANPILGRGPEARRVGRERFVDQHDLTALIHAELELRVGDDDAARRGIFGRFTVKADGEVANLRSIMAAYGDLRLGIRDVFVVLSSRRFGRRREDGLWQFLG